MSGHVVGADADDGHALGLIFLAQPGQLVADVLDVGAVVANEGDQEGRGPFEVVERDGLAIGVREPEAGSRGPERKHRRGCQRHGSSPMVRARGAGNS